MLYSPMNSPFAFESSRQSPSRPSRNPRISSHFHIPKIAHSRNSRKTNTLAHSSQKQGGIRVSVPKRESEKLLRRTRCRRGILRAQQIHQNLVQLRSHLPTVMRVRDIAHRNLSPADRGPYVDRGLRRQTAHVGRLSL